MSINVSPCQLVHPQFLEDVDYAIASAGIHYSDIRLEMVEHQAIEDMANRDHQGIEIQGSQYLTG